MRKSICEIYWVMSHKFEAIDKAGLVIMGLSKLQLMDAPSIQTRCTLKSYIFNVFTISKNLVVRSPTVSPADNISEKGIWNPLKLRNTNCSTVLASSTPPPPPPPPPRLIFIWLCHYSPPHSQHTKTSSTHSRPSLSQVQTGYASRRKQYHLAYFPHFSRTL